jgi:hypothetical protein
VLLLCWCGGIAGRPIGSAPSMSRPLFPAAEQPQRPTIEESRPSIFFLPDKQGKLQPILDFKYEDFIELYKLRAGLAAQGRPPGYTLQRLEIDAVAREKFAELNVAFKLLLREDGWSRAELRFDQALLLDAVEYKGPGRHLFDHDNGNGYVCWVEGKADTSHEILARMLVPLETMGNETRLRLVVPRAAVSRLKLTVPMSEAAATVSEGAKLLETKFSEASTEFTILGPSGNFFAAWHGPQPAASDAPAPLEASAMVLHRLDGHGYSSDALLTVRCLGAAFDRFAVRLPPGAELTPVESSGYVVTPLKTDKTETAASGKLVEVRLPKMTAGPIDARICSRRECDTRLNGGWCELGGFSVVGAARQWGAVAVAAGDDWQVVWGPTSDIRPLDALPDMLRKDDVVAGFEYAGQPYQLSARLAARKTRLSVEPEYVLSVERDRVRLDGKLAYAIRGARASALELSMPGWELDDVGPDATVAVAGVSRGPRGVTLPLTRPMTGAVEVRIRAHLPLAADAKSFSAVLPRPCADSVRPALLAVAAADDVELTPLSEKISGLQRRRDVPPPKLAAGQQPPLYYRATGEEVVYAAELRPRQSTPPPAKDERDNVVLVERAWIQTWLTTVGRQDRAVFQLTADRDSLDVCLPAGAAAYRAAVQIDGAAVEPRVTSENQLSIPLGARGQPRRLTVELRYPFPGQRPQRGAMTLECPRFLPDVWTQRAFWQLVMPANEHLLTVGEEWSDENSWQWRGFFAQRQPAMDQEELEKWSGATARADLPERTNRYLFSSFGPLERLKTHTVGRTWLVFWASGAILLMGLTMINVPLCRGPAAWVIALVAISAAASLSPDKMLLLSQAGCLGLALVLLTWLFQVAARRRSIGLRRSLGGFSSSRLQKLSASPSTKSLPPRPPAQTETAAP